MPKGKKTIPKVKKSFTRLYESKGSFIDLFSGCGGLSLGFLSAGWRGVFAIEKNPDAFRTYRHNLLEKADLHGSRFCYTWPRDLPKECMDIKQLRKEHAPLLEKRRGKITLVAGGPPCQGFSFAGRRVKNDPRNRLLHQYVDVVKLLHPKLLFIENVKGISVAHGRRSWLEGGSKGKAPESYADILRSQLEDSGYEIQQGLVYSHEYGVPQLRPRFLTIGIQNRLLDKGQAVPDFFQILSELREQYLLSHGLPRRPISVSEAISDLRIEKKKLIDCDDPESPRGFKQIPLVRPVTRFQYLMHEGVNGGNVNSMRLPRHKESTIEKFKLIQATCRKGVQLSLEDRKRLGIRKNSTVPLEANKPSHTLTTLPDDLIHFGEPRIHTVRENARIQSFPDWFEFLGKYTTGGARRKSECPRYTQVGNAVPPLLAEACGLALKKILLELDT